MAARPDRSERFASLHVPGRPLLMPNPWDRGSARLLASLGFSALATTSAGFAFTLGRLDGTVTVDEAIEHATQLVDATDVPISADFENAFADQPDDVAANVVRAVETGLAGCSVEDYTGHRDDPFYDDVLAADRIGAAVAAAKAANPSFVITARCEHFLRGRRDLGATIARLQAYQAAGADVLYAPGVSDPNGIKAVVDELERPVNVLATPDAPPVAALADLGVSRVSVGGAFSLVALGALTDAARELLDEGTYGYQAMAATGREVVGPAFG